jgi:outer membrane protein insertion porin family
VPFYDGGNVFRRVSDIFKKGCDIDPADPNGQNLCAKWSHTVGLGFRVKTPLGPFAVDYGYVLNPSEFIVPQFGGATAIHRLSRTQIHFRFGQTF